MSLNLEYRRYGGDLYTWERGSNLLPRMEVGGADTRVQMAHINIKQRFTTRSEKLVALELQYRTKASMCNTISFQDRPQERARTTKEKNKVSGEE